MKRAAMLASGLAMYMLLSGCAGGGGGGGCGQQAQTDVQGVIITPRPQNVEQTPGGTLVGRDQRGRTSGSGQGGISTPGISDGLDKPPSTYVNNVGGDSTSQQPGGYLVDNRDQQGPQTITAPWPQGTQFRVKPINGQNVRQAKKPGDTWWTNPDGSIDPN